MKPKFGTYEYSYTKRLQADELVIGRLYALRLLAKDLITGADAPCRITDIESYADLSIKKVSGLVVNRQARTREVFFGLYDGRFISIGIVQDPETFIPGWPIATGYVLPGDSLAQELPRGVLRAVMNHQVPQPAEIY